MAKYLVPFVVFWFCLFLGWLLGCNFNRSPETAMSLLFAIWATGLVTIPYHGKY